MTFNTFKKKLFRKTKVNRNCQEVLKTIIVKDV